MEEYGGLGHGASSGLDSLDWVWMGRMVAGVTAGGEPEPFATGCVDRALLSLAGYAVGEANTLLFAHLSDTYFAWLVGVMGSVKNPTNYKVFSVGVCGCASYGACHHSTLRLQFFSDLHAAGDQGGCQPLDI